MPLLSVAVELSARYHSLCFPILVDLWLCTATPFEACFSCFSCSLRLCERRYCWSMWSVLLELFSIQFCFCVNSIHKSSFRISFFSVLASISIKHCSLIAFSPPLLISPGSGCPCPPTEWISHYAYPGSIFVGLDGWRHGLFQSPSYSASNTREQNTQSLPPMKNSIHQHARVVILSHV